MTMKQIALALVRLHPPAWRKRYAGEVSALVEESPAGLRDVADLATSCSVEWLRASWRSACIEPDRFPHPARVAWLWTLVVAAMFVGGAVTDVLRSAYVVAVLLSYGVVDRAIEIATGQVVIFRPWPPQNVAMVLAFAFETFFVFGMPAATVAVLARAKRLDRRFPREVRLAVVLAFSTLACLAFELSAVGGALLGGWVLASAFFPRRSATGPGALTTPMVQT